jgi:hypothetical protein
VSTTPAAQLARLKVAYQNWRITRTADGYAAVERSTGRRITADTTVQLESRLARS